MFALALPILGRLLPIVGIALVAWFAWNRVDNWCNGACQSARAETEQVSSELLQLKQVVQQAQERATALALLWADALNKVEVRYVEVARNRADAATRVRERAGRIRHSTDGVSIRVPADALGVLDDARRLANADDPAAPEGDQGAAAPVPDAAGPAADTTLTDWLEFAIDAAEAYRDAADKHQACVAAYEAARTSVGVINEQTEGSGPSDPGVGGQEP